MGPVEENALEDTLGQNILLHALGRVGGNPQRGQRFCLDTATTQVLHEDVAVAPDGVTCGLQVKHRLLTVLPRIEDDRTLVKVESLAPAEHTVSLNCHLLLLAFVVDDCFSGNTTDEASI